MIEIRYVSVMYSTRNLKKIILRTEARVGETSCYSHADATTTTFAIIQPYPTYYETIMGSHPWDIFNTSELSNDLQRKLGIFQLLYYTSTQYTHPKHASKHSSISTQFSSCRKEILLIFQWKSRWSSMIFWSILFYIKVLIQILKQFGLYLRKGPPTMLTWYLA